MQFTGQKRPLNTLTIFILHVSVPGDISYTPAFYEGLKAMYGCVLVDFVEHKLCVCMCIFCRLMNDSNSNTGVLVELS